MQHGNACAYNLTSSYHVGFISPHIIVKVKGWVILRSGKKKRGGIYINVITVYWNVFQFIVSNDGVREYDISDTV